MVANMEDMALPVEEKKRLFVEPVVGKIKVLIT